MIRVLMVFIVYVLGPALIFVWAVKRYKSGVKPDLTEVVAVLLSVALIGVLGYTMYSDVTVEDHSDAQRIVQSLIERYKFPVNAINKQTPAVFGDARGRNIIISVYGVTEILEQQKVVAITEELHKQWGTKPIALKFFQEEIWEQGKDGSMQPARHKETLLHKYLIE